MSRRRRALDARQVDAPARRLEHVPLAQLAGAGAAVNPKRHHAHLGASIDTFRFADAPILDERTGRLVAGHGRVEALVARHGDGKNPPEGVEVGPDGEWLVPVQRGWRSRTDAEAAAFLVAHNRIGEAGGWDDDALAELLRGIDPHLVDAALGADDLGVLPLGFEPDELRALLAEEAGPGANDDVPSVPANPLSVRGEVYQLGPHRLVCGDSTDPADVARVLGDDRARLVWTDPPYGIDYVGGYRPACIAGKCSCHPPGSVIASLKRRRKRVDGKTVKNDALGEAGTRDLVRAALRAIPCVPGAALYMACPAGTLLPFFLAAWEGSGFTFKHSRVWVKDRFVLGRCDYHYRHEEVLYGWREDAGHFWCGRRDLDSIDEYPRPSASEEHPTMKPVALVQAHVAASSEPGDVVYDPFGGSGTTLLACAALGRRARLVELDPAYADVIRRRWGAYAREAGVEPGEGAL